MKTLASWLLLCLCFAVSPVAAGTHSRQHQHGRFLYIPGGPGGSYVLQYWVDSLGHGHPLTPASFPTLGSTYAVVISHDGYSLYAIEGDYFNVAQFHIRRNGTLEPMSIPQVLADAHPTALVFDPNGHYAYVSCSHGDVCQYRVSDHGELIALSPREISIRKFGLWDPSPVRFDSTGRNATILGSDPYDKKTVVHLSVKLDGTLVPQSSRP